MDPQAIKDWASGATGGEVVPAGAGAADEESVVDDTSDTDVLVPLQDVAASLLDLADSADATLAEVEDKGDIPDKITTLREIAEAIKIKGEELAEAEEEDSEGDEDSEDSDGVVVEA